MTNEKQEEFENRLYYHKCAGSTCDHAMTDDHYIVSKEFMLKEKSLSYSQAVQDCLGRVPKKEIVQSAVDELGRPKEPTEMIDIRRAKERNKVISEVEESIKSLLK